MAFSVIGCFLIRKSEKEINLICHFFITLFWIMCYQVLAACLLSFIPNGVSIITVGIADFILGAICWGNVWKHKKVQRFRLWKADIIAVIVFMVLALFWGVHQFGPSLDLFNYRSTIDCTRHLLFARGVAVKHSLNDIPFMAVNTGLWFEALYPFMHKYYDYLLIIRTDIVMIFLSAITFWALIRNHLRTNTHILIGLAAAVLYTSGFPVNNMVFGTSYLGAGVTCVILICKLISMYYEEEINIHFFCIGLLVSMAGLGKAYPLFFPIVLISSAVFITYKFMINIIKPSKWIKFVVPALAVLCALCVVIICKLMSFGPLAQTGYIYQNLFSDLAFLLPVVFYRIYWCFKKDKVEMDYVLALFVGLFVCAMLIAAYSAKISAYYYYKTYYLFWMAAFYVAVMVMVSLGEEALRIVYSILFTCSFIALYSITGLEGIIQSVTEGRGFGINEGVTVADFFSLYTWNYRNGDKKNMCISPEKQELFQMVAQLSEGSAVQTPYVGLYFVHQYDYYAMAYQWEDYEFFNCDTQEFIETVKEKCEYICLVYEEADQSPWEIGDYLRTLEVKYKNEAGVIYIVQ